MLIINFEGREAKGLSEGRFDETFAGEDGFCYAIFSSFTIIAVEERNEPQHEVSNNLVCADQPANMHSLIRAFASL